MGNVIKDRREKLGYSQSEFAKLADINFRTLQDYEQGRKPISSMKGEVLYKVSSCLECSMEELIDVGCQSGIESQLQHEMNTYLRLSRYADILSRHLDQRHNAVIGTPYDDVFRTLSVDCPVLLIPVINYALGEHFSMDTRIRNLQNEHLRSDVDGNVTRRISDANIIVLDDGVERYFQIECQSNVDNAILVRLMEYASASSIENSTVEGESIHITIPKSALIYLRHNSNTPDEFQIAYHTPGGDVSWSVPVIKTQLLSIDEIFEHKLFMLIPYYLMVYEKQLTAIEREESRTKALKQECIDIFNRLSKCNESGIIDSYQYETVRRMSKKILEVLMRNNLSLGKEVGEVMGGKVLEYEAKDIKRAAIREGRMEGRMEGRIEGRMEGRIEGIFEGRMESIKNLMTNCSMTFDQAMDAIGIPQAEREQYTHRGIVG